MSPTSNDNTKTEILKYKIKHRKLIFPTKVSMADMNKFYICILRTQIMHTAFHFRFIAKCKRLNEMHSRLPK